MDREETPLHGGNLNVVVRVGDTVRRSPRPWSPAVQGLLRHLEVRGFDGAPRFLGIDAQGREILSFIPGEVGSYPLPPYMWSDATLVEAARLLRRFHDATAGYVPLPGVTWQLVYPGAGRHEVICHNDVAPYNMVFAEGRPYALIDFDTAGPGPRIWDIAYAVYTFVPLASFAPRVDGSTAPYEVASHAAERARRLRLFCHAYGSQPTEELLQTVERRLDALCSTVIEGAAAGDAGYQHLIDTGHLDHYRREIAFLQRHASDWKSSIR
ncbi:MAG: hypothetical protein QOF73_3346 [Thermomicrobiales bacterium]|jgi:hypothetical protein|nr:hypothetical protein [Thermomicrobiales bacterium]